MPVSVFELFNIGIGPSSSHTVGPMKAARTFATDLAESGQIAATASIKVALYGSLAATGRGHGTDKAVAIGLESDAPETVDIETFDARFEAIRQSQRVMLAGTHPVAFHHRRELIAFKRQTLAAHPNGIRFTALDDQGETLATRLFFSVGGGFVVEADDAGEIHLVADATRQRYPFRTGAELLAHCERESLSISEVMMANECAWRDEADVRASLLEIWAAMRACIQRGCERDGHLPGPMQVRRRAVRLAGDLQDRSQGEDQLERLDWVTLYALAVNEENAAGARVVTAPTNGAAGILPAVLNYLVVFHEISDDDIVRFLLTAGAICVLYKENASISGAEVGCQGEVGVACSMAAGAMAEVLGASPAQVENAAEIGMEHNLGLTCDPIGGLVQVPCIERNAMGAIKAINAARMARRGDGTHCVSLDKVIATMRATGADMKTKYKETSRGGLAVNIIEC